MYIRTRKTNNGCFLQVFDFFLLDFAKERNVKQLFQMSYPAIAGLKINL